METRRESGTRPVRALRRTSHSLRAAETRSDRASPPHRKTDETEAEQEGCGGGSGMRVQPAATGVQEFDPPSNAPAFAKFVSMS